MSCLAVFTDLDKMQLVGAAEAISRDQSMGPGCALCPTEGSVGINSTRLEVARKSTGQPYYLCTVTCCDSANCTKPSTTSLIGKAIVTKADSSCLYSQHWTEGMCRPLPNGFASHLDKNNCPICIKARQTRARLVYLANSTSEDRAGTPTTKTGEASANQCNGNPEEPLTGSSSKSNGAPKTEVCNAMVGSVYGKNSTIRHSPKLQYLSTENSKSHSPEMSSPPVLGTSSFTDYTESYTPVCTSANSNQAEWSSSPFKFSVSRKASPLHSEYSFYFSSSVEHHGFFRKAVPALPIAVAVLLCMCNLVIPGSGTRSDPIIKQSLTINSGTY